MEAMTVYWGVEGTYGSTHFQTSLYMELSDRLRFPGEQALVHTEQEAGWAPVQVWKL
jgi:hypothetical protein